MGSLAQVQDVAKVSLEAGNSFRMMFSNYCACPAKAPGRRRELVQPADAEKWFAVALEAVAKQKAESRE